MTLDDIRTGLATGTIELVSPPSPEYEEMQAWYEWFLLLAAIFLRIATAFGKVAAWSRWGQMMQIAADYATRRDGVFAWMVQWQKLCAPPVFLARASPWAPPVTFVLRCASNALTM